jgi:hypothetical protein
MVTGLCWIVIDIHATGRWYSGRSGKNSRNRETNLAISPEGASPFQYDFERQEERQANSIGLSWESIRVTVNFHLR